MSCHDIQVGEILRYGLQKMLSSTRTSKATGHDRVSPELLKDNTKL